MSLFQVAQQHTVGKRKFQITPQKPFPFIFDPSGFDSEKKTTTMKTEAYLQLLLLLALGIGATLSVAEFQSSSSTTPRPHADESFNFSYIQMTTAETCPYTVVISTSCLSPERTEDHISIAFGDAAGNQIYAPRLDDPTSSAFERCSTDTFKLNGPCAHQICYVYLYRSGNDGWKPRTVNISGDNTKAVTFEYDTFIPPETWYGFNLCHKPSSSHHLSVSNGFLCAVLAFVFSFFMYY